LRLGNHATSAGYRLEVNSPTNSTNTDVLARAQEGDRGHLWCVATEQTSGRGRHGRAWQTGPGNLAASVLVFTKATADRLATLGFVAGVALVRALQSGRVFGGRQPEFTLKWPNDVLANGAKLAGILLETRQVADSGQAVAVGLGVNIVSAPEGVPYPTTATALLGGTGDAGVVLTALGDEWARQYARWDEGRGLENVLADWRSLAHGMGGPVGAQVKGQPVSGIFEDIDVTGRLLIRDGFGKQTAIGAGEVFFGTPGQPVHMEVQ